ncbi:MAG TPA: hypothetical protein DDY41_07000 [Arthrobacter bacterium]|jgi:hypothetical protein|nr:hypothetical protein [Arthrobacter sp.]
MTTSTDPRLGEIAAALAWRVRSFAPADVAYLIAELRKRDDALDVLMRELVAREERWRLAYVAGDLTHEEASEIALEDRWVYAQLADIRAAVTAAKGDGE